MNVNNKVLIQKSPDNITITTMFKTVHENTTHFHWIIGFIKATKTVYNKRSAFFLEQCVI